MENFSSSILMNDKIEEKFYCDFENCDFRTKSTSHLKLHKKSVHEGIKHQCDLCDRSYNFPGKVSWLTSLMLYCWLLIALYAIDCKLQVVKLNLFYVLHVRRSEEAQEDNSRGFPLSLSLLRLLCQSNSDSEEPHQQTPFTFVKLFSLNINVNIPLKIQSKNDASLFVAFKALTTTTTPIKAAHQGLIKMTFHNPESFSWNATC